MPPIITVSGTPISFPDSSASPNWSPAIIQFAQAVAQSLNGVTGTFDIPAQTFSISNYNPGSNVVISNLAFSTSEVRGAYIKYSVYRTTSSITVTEIGEIDIVYNPTNPTGNLWEISLERTGDAEVSFAITDTGQVTISTNTLAGTSHQGVLTFAAQSLQNS